MLKNTVFATLRYALSQAVFLEYRFKQQLTRLFGAALLVIVSSLIFYLALFFTLMALFFQLAGIEALVQPALITSGVSLLITALLMIRAVYMVKRSK